MNLQSLQDAAAHELEELLDAEQQLAKALPRMAGRASNPELRRAFETHARQTAQHVERLKQVFAKLGRTPRAQTSEAMRGLIEESETVMARDSGDPHVIDAELICAAQKCEHYEIATYGTVCAWLGQLGQDEALQLCRQNQSDEGQSDRTLTELANASVNLEAIGIGGN